MKIEEDSLLLQSWRPLEDAGMKPLCNRPLETGGTKEVQCRVPWVCFITDIAFLRIKFSMSNEQLTLPSIKHNTVIAESIEQAPLVV